MGHKKLHSGTFACFFSTRVKAVCLRICQSVICVLLTVSGLCRLKPPWPIKKRPWYNGEENSTEKLSLS